jgi:hypothetical protein
MLSFSKINFKEIVAFPKKLISTMKFGNLQTLKADTVEIKSICFPEKAAIASLNRFKFVDDLNITKKTSFQINDIKPIQIFEIQKDGNQNPIKAFMAIVQRFDKVNEEKTGLFVFSKEGKILGNIETLDKEEYLKNNLKEKNPDKYLRLHALNASYFENYKGIGAILIEEAKLKSQQYGLGGNLKVYASNYLKDKKRHTPIPFYAKMGFIDIENPNLSKEDLVKKYTSTNRQIYMFFLAKG